MYTAQKTNGNNLIAFIGGFIGAMTYYIGSIQTLLAIKEDDLLDFTIHSMIGGAIMVAVKVLGEWILYKLKTPKQKQQEKND